MNLIESIRTIIGSPQFYLPSGALDYGAIFEYFGALILLSICVCSIFKIIRSVFES